MAGPSSSRARRAWQDPADPCAYGVRAPARVGGDGGTSRRRLGSSAYRPIAEALQSALRLGPLPDSAELVPYQSALGRLIPEWRQPAAAAWTADASWLLAEGVLRLVRALARQEGALVVLEDLHWSDPDSLALVE